MQNGQSVFFLSPHTERVRLARFARKTLTPRFTDFFSDLEKKKPTVLQSKEDPHYIWRKTVMHINKGKTGEDNNKS